MTAGKAGGWGQSLRILKIWCGSWIHTWRWGTIKNFGGEGTASSWLLQTHFTVPLRCRVGEDTSGVAAQETNGIFQAQGGDGLSWSNYWRVCKGNLTHPIFNVSWCAEMLGIKELTIKSRLGPEQQKELDYSDGENREGRSSERY